MENIRIYLSGGMTGVKISEQIGWRNRFKDAINIQYKDEIKKKPIIFSPPDYYTPIADYHKSEKEVMEFELAQLRKSDVVVVNFNKPDSIGTAMELMLAKENKIPVIGLCSDTKILHPWLIECCTRVCNNFRELVEHIVNYYLN